MKKILMLCVAMFVFTNFNLAQTAPKIPPATVKKLDGTKINTNTFSNNGDPMIIVFWAT